ncbi:MAG: aminotransferase family protein [Chloroflexota bacterium]
MSNQPGPGVDLDTLWRPFYQHALKQQPLVIAEGRGCLVWDTEGKEYLDAMAGLWCVNVGFGQERLAEAAAEQMRRLAYTPSSRPAPPTFAIAKRLTELLPGDLNHAQFLNSGSEAVEAALKIARQYARQRYPKQNRHKIIARYRGYHGWTNGAMSATGQFVRKSQFEPLIVGGAVHVRPPDTFRMFPGMTPAEAAKRMAQEIVEVILFEGAETIAAFIGEPIIGGGGVIVPPDDYWPLVRGLCDKYGILLINDEVITGFGRTGKWFGCMQYGIVPDIITLAKGISSGYMPMAATVVTDAVFDAFLGDPADNLQFNQISTFGGHPVSAAVALANLDLIEEKDLVGNSARMGEVLGESLRKMQSRHPGVGDVRGRGLIWGVELVVPGTKDALPPAQVNQVMGEAQKRGLLLGKNSSTVSHLECVLTIAPPLIITAAEVDRLVTTLDAALTAAKL